MPGIRLPVLPHLLACALLLFGNLAQAAPMSAIDQVQLYANRATVSLLLLRGEGFQQAHLNRLQQDIADLQAATREAVQNDPALQPLSEKLVKQLQAGVAYGPDEDKMPWRYPEDLAQSLRDLLTHASQQPSADPNAELPAKVEYLAVQYLSRSYIGNFEIAREQPEHYLGQDERRLVPTIDEELARLDSQDPQLNKLKMRWKYLRSALLDMNSQSNALTSNSGRAFAPTTVDRHARALSNQWISLSQAASTP